MTFYDLLADVETQAQASASLTGINLVKAIENSLTVRNRESDAVVTYRYLDGTVVGPGHLDDDLTPVWAVLHRIVHQIHQYLLDAQWIDRGLRGGEPLEQQLVIGGMRLRPVGHAARQGD